MSGRPTADIEAELRDDRIELDAVDRREAADRLAELDKWIDNNTDELIHYQTVLAAVIAALDQYDKDEHPADPHVLFAFITAVAKAVGR